MLLQFPYVHSSLYGHHQGYIWSTTPSLFVDLIIVEYKPVYPRCLPCPPVSLD
jgi:hypothetical protein